MSTAVENIIVQTTVAILTPIVGIIAAIICASVKKYLHIKIDETIITNNSKTQKLIDSLAHTAVLKVEDEFKNSDIEDKIEKGTQKLNAATAYVYAMLEKSGVKVKIDTTDVEGSVRAMYQTLFGEYSEWCKMVGDSAADAIAKS